MKYTYVRRRTLYPVQLVLCILCAYACLWIMDSQAARAIDVLTKQKDWFLGAVGTNFVDQEQPTYNACVKINAQFTKFESECVYLWYEKKFHKSKIIKIHGIDDANITQIYSLAPIYDWNPNDTTDKFTTLGVNTTYNINTVMKQPFCRNNRTKRHRSNRFLVTQVEQLREDWLLLLGIHPILHNVGSEYHCGILTKTKMLINDVKKLVARVNLFSAQFHQGNRCPRFKLNCFDCSSGYKVNWNFPIGK